MNPQNVTEIAARLTARGNSMLAQPAECISFTGNAQADRLLNDLAVSPHAYVLACLMDRGVPAERAWLVPHQFRSRLGTFAMERLAALSRDEVHELFLTPSPLHRYKGVMANVFYDGIKRIAEQYDGNASLIWTDNPSSTIVVKRFRQFTGAGPKISTMAANILAREFRIAFSDKTAIDISVDVHIRRTFIRLGLVEHEADDFAIIHTARALNPHYPGVFDLPLWDLGKSCCRPTKPSCSNCWVSDLCPTATNL